jgi:hypothetical protein
MRKIHDRQSRTGDVGKHGEEAVGVADAVASTPPRGEAGPRFAVVSSASFPPPGGAV